MSSLIMFRSLTHAQRASRVLAHSGIPAGITKAPQGTTDKGCTYCLQVTDSRLYASLNALQREGIDHGRVLQQRDGVYREVSL
ncbi:MAG: DUF3343 domain-containing protein [Oscillospiraceae bacterium]|nr:DUF3343 domain-containing protein [Oscillospiraceae bacterium]